MIRLSTNSFAILKRVPLREGRFQIVLIALLILSTFLLVPTSSLAQSQRSFEETVRRESTDRVVAFKFLMEESQQETRLFVNDAIAHLGQIVERCRLSRSGSLGNREVALAHLADIMRESSAFQQKMKVSVDSIQSRYEAVVQQYERHCASTQPDLGLWLDCVLRAERKFYIATVTAYAKYIWASTPRVIDLLAELKACLQSNGTISLSEVKLAHDTLLIFHSNLDDRMNTLREHVRSFMKP